MTPLLRQLPLGILTGLALFWASDLPWPWWAQLLLQVGIFLCAIVIVLAEQRDLHATPAPPWRHPGQHP